MRKCRQPVGLTSESGNNKIIAGEMFDKMEKIIFASDFAPIRKFAPVMKSEPVILLNMAVGTYMGRECSFIRKGWMILPPEYSDC